MFTGIVQELALVDKVTSSSFGISLEIARPIAFADIVIGESIALNGACLTVASYSSKIISFNLAGGSTWRVLPYNLTALILKSNFGEICKLWIQ